MTIFSFRRVATVTATAAVAVGLLAGPASAHVCYVNNLTPQAVAGAGASNGFATFGDIASEFTGLCPAGVQVLADAAGVEVTTPVNVHAVMAGGAQAQGRQAGGIGYLDFAALDDAFPAAAAACA
jgi:hypothetical protein